MRKPRPLKNSNGYLMLGIGGFNEAMWMVNGYGVINYPLTVKIEKWFSQYNLWRTYLESKPKRKGSK